MLDDVLMASRRVSTFADAARRENRGGGAMVHRVICRMDASVRRFAPFGHTLGLPEVDERFFEFLLGFYLPIEIRQRDDRSGAGASDVFLFWGMSLFAGAFVQRG